MDHIVLKVDGMTCQHCLRAVKGALESVSGVSGVDVSLDKGTAAVTGATNVEALLAAVTREGYLAKPLA